MSSYAARSKPGSARGSALLAGALLLSTCMGCGPATPLEDVTLVSNRNTLQGDNGLAENGLAENGLAENGLAESGLAESGLARNLGFVLWFHAAPRQRAQLMQYLVACVVPAGQVRTYTSPFTGASYTWRGNLGLAPGWASGRSATVLEQQVVSACLAAHVNPYGAHTTFSLLGLDATGNPIRYSETELATFSVREACFFGNVFTNEGIYVGNDRNQLSSSQSSLRGCGLSSTLEGASPVCPTMERVGFCERSRCTLDAQGLYYTQCTHNGVSYRPVTTRLLPSTLYQCGDGVCQGTERCGAGATPASCHADCGPCS